MANLLQVNDAYAAQIAQLLAIGRQTIPVQSVVHTTLWPTWAQSLAVGAVSGGTSPVVSVGDHLTFDDNVGVAAAGNVRVGTDWTLAGAGSTGDGDVLRWVSDRVTLGGSSYPTTVAASGTGLDLRVGGAVRLFIQSTYLESRVPTLRFISTAASPIITQDGVSGQTLTIQAQGGTGATAGGDLVLKGGPSGAASNGGDSILEGGDATGLNGGDAIVRGGATAAANPGNGRMQHQNGRDAILVQGNPAGPHTGGQAINVDGTGLAFFNGTTVTQPAIVGAKGGNVALTNLLTALASMGLIIDNTT